MKFFCTEHGGAVDVDESELGGEIGCPDCGAVLRVPTELLAPGMVLDDFVLDGVISRGEAIVTLRAHQLSMDRPVALRVLRPEYSQDDVQVARFLQEARGSAALTHPNLLRTFAISQAEGLYFSANELVEGQPLDHWLQEHGAAEAEWVLARARELVAGLAEAWAQAERVHGDLHPKKILIRDRDDSLCILRMGMDPPSPEQLRAEDARPELTYFAAPERLEGGAPTMQSDMYSVGAILYRLVTGLAPVDGATAAEVARGHLSGVAESPRQVNETVPAALSDWIMMLLSRDAAGRPADYAAMRASIDDCETALAQERADAAAAEQEASRKQEALKAKADTRTRGMKRTRGGAVGQLARAASETRAMNVQPDAAAKKSPLPILAGVLVALLAVLGLVLVVALSQRDGTTTPTTPGGSQATTDTSTPTRNDPAAAGDGLTPPTELALSSFTPKPGPLAGLPAGEPVRIIAMGDWLLNGDSKYDRMQPDFESTMEDAGHPTTWLGRLGRDDYATEAGRGYSIAQIRAGHFWADETSLPLAERLQATKPHVVLLHIGSHDLDERLADADWRLAADRARQLIHAIHDASPDTYIVVTTLVSPPRPETQLLVDHYNDRLTRLVTLDMLAGLPVAIVPMHRVAQRDHADLYTNFPSQDQYARIGKTFYNAVSRWSSIRPSWPDDPPVAPIASVNAGDTPVSADFHTAGLLPGGLIDGSALAPTAGWQATAPIVQSPIGQPITYQPDSRPSIDISLERASDIQQIRLWTVPAAPHGKASGQIRQVQFLTSTDGKRWDKQPVITVLPAPRVDHIPGQQIDVRWRGVRHIRLLVLDSWDRQSVASANSGQATVRLLKIQVHGASVY